MAESGPIGQMGWVAGTLMELLQKERTQPGRGEWGTHVNNDVMTIVQCWAVLTVRQAQCVRVVTSSIPLTTHGADGTFRPIPVKRKPRHRAVKHVAQGHTAGKWLSQAQIQAVTAKVYAPDLSFVVPGHRSLLIYKTSSKVTSI